jgi:hypothetical protein
MNIAEEFMQGNVACEVDGCTEVATTVVRDFGHLFGQGAVAVELPQVGPTHFFCNRHKRASYSFKREHGQWVRF